jgi:hypothetical protein
MNAAKNAEEGQWRDVLAKVKGRGGVVPENCVGSILDPRVQPGYAYYNIRQYRMRRAHEAGLVSALPIGVRQATGHTSDSRSLLHATQLPRQSTTRIAVLPRARPRTHGTLGQAYFQSGDNKNSMRVMNDVINISSNAGRFQRANDVAERSMPAARAGFQIARRECTSSCSGVRTDYWETSCRFDGRRQHGR